jgi:DTW domain-containing protein YfiP
MNQPADKIKITLLTHFKEIPKRSNTGRLVLELLGDAAEQVQWDRLNPPDGLIEEIEAGNVALIYPGASDEPETELSGISHFILIDSTWTEARKIHQRSPYLQKARRISLKPDGPSRYNLRKNQKRSGLCTAECVIEILKKTGNIELADQLEARFLAFLRPANAFRRQGRLCEENPDCPENDLEQVGI